MKNKFKLLALFGLSLLTTSVVSCSSFFGDDGYVISSYSVNVDPTTGNTLLTIVFSNEEVEPLTISIPKGISGDDGVGIKKVTPVYEENRVVITIEYSDDSIEDTILSIPFGEKGDDGKGIKEVNIDTLENGDISIQFVYTDESVGEPIIIPKGKDGNGIRNIQFSHNDLTNSTDIVIIFTDQNMAPVMYSIPDGKDGIGIVSIEYSEEYSDENNYCLVVTYSDGYVTNRSDSIYIPRPKSTVWYSGSSNPSNTIGKEGDFYLNEINGNIYKKVNGVWVYLFSLSGAGSSVSYELTFDVNGGSFVWNTGTISTIRKMVCDSGQYFDLSNTLLEVEKEGYKFEGWWTSPDYKLDPNAGHFTSLTPVLSDLTLYANWSVVE